MPREWMHNNDELYDNMRGPIENVHLLATAYSKGTQETRADDLDGRATARAASSTRRWATTSAACAASGSWRRLQRGTEWAATGTVTLPLPANFPTDKKISTIK